MVCIHCRAKTQVFNSRLQKKPNQVWRRRKCICGHVFTTIETADYASQWLIRGTREPLSPFLRDRLFISLLASLQHRKTALSDASALTDTVIQKLRTEMKDGTTDTTTISRLVQVALNRFDKPASVHYQAMHQH